MNGGKKYVVISPEEYERLKNDTIRGGIVNPLKRDMHKSEREMSSVLNRSTIPVDERIRQFTEELNNMKSRYEGLTKQKPLEIVMKPNTTLKEEAKQMDIIEESVIQSASKTNKTNAKLVLDYLKSKPEIIKWNKLGEVIFRGERVPGSNITDLIIDTVSKRKKSDISNPLYKSVFMKALSETNVPRKWIKNREHYEILNSYNEIKNSPAIRDSKKMKIDWSSSI